MSAYRNRDDFGPITRNRSSSANEASKPIVMLHRRPTQLGGKPSNFSPSNGSNGGKLYFAFLFRFLVSLTFCCVCIFHSCGPIGLLFNVFLLYLHFFY